MDDCGNILSMQNVKVSLCRRLLANLISVQDSVIAAVNIRNAVSAPSGGGGV